MSARKILFVATEDWFVRSHFMPLLRRAREDGYEVVVAARGSGADLEGARLIDTGFARGSLSPIALVREARALRRLLRTERPSVVHAIALKPSVLLLFAGDGVPSVFAITGRGYLAVGAKLWARLALAVLARALRGAVAARRAILMVENNADRRWVEGGKPLADERVALMPGAGVDPDRFAPADEPPSPIVVGVAARLVRSKGIDLAVEAVRRLREEGMEVSLHIAGAADPDNPEHVDDDTIGRWRVAPGVSLLGRVSDVNAFWASVHVACLPSRGGEGLPRTLLEAAACGRPLVTSDAPGCGDFVISRQTGLVVARGDVDALTGALRQLCESKSARVRMGAAARARVLAGFTEAHAAVVASEAWRRLIR